MSSQFGGLDGLQTAFITYHRDFRTFIGFEGQFINTSKHMDSPAVWWYHWKCMFLTQHDLFDLWTFHCGVTSWSEIIIETLTINLHWVRSYFWNWYLHIIVNCSSAVVGPFLLLPTCIVYLTLDDHRCICIRMRIENVELCRYNYLLGQRQGS